MVPSIRSHRVVSDSDLHLSVAYDVTCVITFFELCKLCLNEMPKSCHMHDTFKHWMKKSGKRVIHSKF